MLKIIPTKQVCLGMFIHELQGPWLEHPFWKTGFKLEDPEDLKKLQTSAVSALVIDTAKGLDVDSLEVPVDIDSVPATKTKAKLSYFNLERERLGQVIAESKAIVITLFHDLRMGKALCAPTALALVDTIVASLVHNSDALISLVRLKHKDDYPYLHPIAVCALMIVLAKQLGLSSDKIRQAGLAGLLHDIGKTAIDTERPNRSATLIEAEFSKVKLHPEIGHALLLKANITDSVVLDVCLHHHEKISGLGYPHQLKADAISIFARMAAVCNVYDSITSNRPYKEGLQPGMALQDMSKLEGQFDDRIFRALVKSIGIYPVGTLVKLQSGRLGVVVEQGANSLLKPVIKIFYSMHENARIPIVLIDLAFTDACDSIVGHAEPADCPLCDMEEVLSFGYS